MRLPEAVVFERDNRAFELRKAGLTYRQIAKALDVSEYTAHTAVRRVMERIGKRLAENSVDVVRLELERLDSLMQNLWGMTMPHKVRDQDGNEITLPPNLDAVDRVLKIMDRRAKLLGLDSVTLNLNHNQGPSIGTADGSGAETTPEVEARRLMRLMAEAGVIDGNVVAGIRRALGEEIVEAAAAEAPPRPMLGAGMVDSADDEEDIPHEWSDDDDDS